MQDLGSAFWGFVLAKAPFSRSNGSEGTNTNLPELVPPTEPLKSVSRGRCLPQSGPEGGLPRDSRVVWPLVGARATHMVPEACWAGSLLAVLLLWPSRLATIVSPREFGPTQASYRTYRRINNFPTDGANCRVAVFELSPLQWICRKWVQKLGSDKMTACFGGEKHTESGGPTSQGEGTVRLRTGISNPSRSHRSLLPSFGPPSLWVISIVIYSSLLFIPLLHLLVIHVYPQVHVPSAILSSALWAAVAPNALSRGHIHINGVRVLAVGI